MNCLKPDTDKTLLMLKIVYAKTHVQWNPHFYTKIQDLTILHDKEQLWWSNQHVLIMKLSKRTQLSHFQHFIPRTFLDNSLLLKKSRRQFIFLFTPATHILKFNF